MLADTSSTNQHSMADLSLNDAHLLCKLGQCRHRSRYIDMVAAAQRSVTGRDKCLAVANNGTHEYLAATKHMRQMMKNNILEQTTLIDTQLDDFYTSFCKGFTLQKARNLHQTENFSCRFSFRVNDQRQAELLTHHIKLFGIFRITYAGNSVQGRIHTSCCKAAKQVNFILAGRCDQNVGLLYLCLFQRSQSGTITGEIDHIRFLHFGFKFIGI